MATKKAQVTDTKPTSIVKWEEKFAKYAKQSTEQVKNIGTSGVSIKFGHGTIEVGGAAIPGGRLECIIIGSCAMNAWNKDAYDAKNPLPPDCYAFGDVRDPEDPDQVDHTINGVAISVKAGKENPDKLEMRPMPQSPLKQSETCGTCPKNVMGSATTGRGKACANTVRIGAIVAKDAKTGKDAAAAEIATAKFSYMNSKTWAKYVKQLADDHGRPPWSVVTEISSHHDDQIQIRQEFKLVDLIEDNGVLEALERRYLKIQGLLQQPFSAAAKSEASGPAVKAGASRKFATKGKK